jgi:hypothetical protein
LLASFRPSGPACPFGTVPVFSHVKNVIRNVMRRDFEWRKHLTVPGVL